MAVIITDMKFPKRCLDCQLMGREKMYCQLHPRKNLNVIRVVSEKPEWCPLKEVPMGKLERENEALKNRCFVLSGGTMCMFCPIDCDKRNVPFRGVVEEQQGENTNG